MDYAKYALRAPTTLLPDARFDLSRWAVVACDQYTSQPEYWQHVSEIAGDAPSALNLIYPEAWLDRGDRRIGEINAAMREYASDVLTRETRGFVLVERTLAHGARLGLMAEFDLENYDFAPGSAPLIRATEDTVLSRIPPRVKIRKDAVLELPHVMMLADDPGRTLIEPLYARRGEFEKLTDFELMLGGGNMRTWRVPDDIDLTGPLEALYARAGGMLWAVGDGNHSLAAARQCWLDMRETLPEEARENHPARYALAELVNLRDPALTFEPIHRALFGERASLISDLEAFLGARTMALEAGDMFALIANGGERGYAIGGLEGALPLAVLQRFLDEWLDTHPAARIDYVHGDAALRALCAEGALGILLPAPDKGSVFEAVRRFGRLPRKAFSMGEADEKRFYLEARRIGEI